VTGRLFLGIAGMEARRRLTYRADFWIAAVIGILVHFAVSWFVWFSIFENGGATRIAGFDLPAMAAYYAGVLLASRLVRGSELESAIATDIYEGHLNRYLVLPASYFRLKYAQHLGSMLPLLVQVVVLTGVAIVLVPASPDVEVTPGGIARAAVSLALANLLHFLLSFPIQAFAFWADNVWSLSVMLRFTTDLLGGLMLPLAVFPGWAQEAGRWLPFRCLFAAPVETALGRMGPEAWAESLWVGAAWCVAIGLVARAVWRRGTLQYSGVGM
jgi:ABC-2 type transport system permease protein